MDRGAQQATESRQLIHTAGSQKRTQFCKGNQNPVRKQMKTYESRLCCRETCKMRVREGRIVTLRSADLQRCTENGYTPRPPTVRPRELDSSSSAQFSRSVASDPMDRSTPGLPVHQQLPQLTETHVHGVSDADL